MTRNSKLLHNLLRTLVEEWGFDRVAADLEHFGGAPPPTAASPARRSGMRHPVIPARGQAVAQVLRARLPPDQEAPLLVLAERFDNKTFLPSVADAREFLGMMGDDASTLKDRSAAFPLVLRRLRELTPAQIEAIAASPRFSGPARLGPLSEAIAAAASAIARQS